MGQHDIGQQRANAGQFRLRFSNSGADRHHLRQSGINIGNVTNARHPRHGFGNVRLGLRQFIFQHGQLLRLQAKMAVA